MLPGDNCGVCGYAGCGMLAQAICNNEVPVSVCSALKEDEIRNIASLLEQTVTDSIRMKAYIKCTGGTNCQNRYEYFGPADCICMSQYDGGVKSCIYGCVGGGSCQRVCPFDAVIMNEYNMAEIVYDKCTGCGVCSQVCPVKALIMTESEKIRDKDYHFKIINPKSIIIMGHTSNYTQQQKDDFEVIKRKYTNVLDIISYEDLIHRLETIINALKVEKGD